MEEAKPTFEELRREIHRRCEAVNFECKDIEPPGNGRDPSLAVLLPAGREKRSVVVEGVEEASRLLSTSFEEYCYVGDYDAIANYSGGVIEVVTRPAERFVPSSWVARRLFELPIPPEGADLRKARIEVHRGTTGESITFAPPSRELRALIERADRGNSFSVRIAGPQLRSQDHAIERLETLANAFLFQVELRTGIALLLARSHQHSAPPGLRDVRDGSSAGDWSFPEYTFPREPLELYWYGRSARGMPLLEFLAYYQVLEYFFPTFSEREARVRARNVLKDPTFNPERETDLSRLLSVIRVSAQGTFGSERSQLKETIRACVVEHELRDALMADPATKDYFCKKHACVRRTLNLNPASDDIRDQVAERLYEIRCSIVHTKSDGNEAERPVLLPFSREAMQLQTDVNLARLIARRVLVASGVPHR